jgi:diketogulonate reductase-like aldo/keto reductase
LEQLLKVCKYKPVVNQIEIHPFYYDEDTINFCRENDILVEAYAPFASGN